VTIGVAERPPSASGLEQHLADLEVAVGDKPRAGKDLMVEMQVACGGATPARPDRVAFRDSSAA